MEPMIKKINFTVFIGRFQPVHLGHLETIRKALNYSKKLIIIIGGYKKAPSTRMPWNAAQRIMMIKKCLTHEERKKIIFIPIRDRTYSERVWNQNVIQEVLAVTYKEKGNNTDEKTIALIGHNKDESSYYLKNFPNWPFIETGNFQNINSTDFRKVYFSNQNASYKIIPDKIKAWLKIYRKTYHFKQIKDEYLFVEKIKQQLTQNSFTVGNCLLLCGNYILLIRRKNHPGKYLFALPGGHIKNNEEPHVGALRELYEETQIKLNPQELASFFVAQSYFDHPERNPIARYYAHVFFYRLNFMECPCVTANDDAHEAGWFLLDDLCSMEDKFFSDHYQIVQKFLGRINE